ncbi:ThuA domain-containing protein [Zobellia barbeyronii]|uniref:ThuA domain-containing protein n=1 Tax=Zobellia barbeyronii TaxID=2748009 RepID=A0ABS5WAM1_9FLAO|nr:ThuA domain-containing protein [Zobellia barbeyronii]MBT2160448.1 ThuA domain-containing protein [Zobellia barbeyronii]
MKERPIIGTLSALFMCILLFFIACDKDKSDDTVAIAPDVEAPLPPEKLETVQVTDSSITVTWKASKDNVKVVQYAVYQDSVEVARDSIITYEAKNLKPATEYTFAVRAADAAGNNSKFSEQIKVLTEAIIVEDTIVKNDSIGGFSSILRSPLLSLGKILTNSVELKWQLEINASVVKEYRIFQDTLQIGNVNTKSYKVTDLIAGKGYKFSVAAVDLTGKESKPSNVLEVETPLVNIQEQDTIAPTVPTGLKANDIQINSIKLAWNAAADSVGVTGYTIYNDTTRIAKVTDTLYLLENLEAGTEYGFRVSASDAAENESIRSEALFVSTIEEVETDSIALGAPKNLQIAELGSIMASFTWSAENDSVQASEYTVYIDTVLVANTTKPEYIAENLTPNTAYSFSVTVTDDLGNKSNKSDPLNFTTLGERVVFKDTIAPTVPKSITIDTLTSSSIKLTWEASVDSIGVVDYQIFQDEKLIDTSIGTNYSVENLSADTEYTFSVSATDEAQNESQQSEAVLVRTEVEIAEQKATDITAPTVPQKLVSEEITQTTIDLNWEASTDSVGVSGYRVFQNGVFLAIATKTAYQAVNLEPGMEYAFSVSAIDEAENESKQSALLELTTEAEVYVDDVAPSIPTSLMVGEVTQTTVDLNWEASTDNVGVSGYRVLQNGVFLAMATKTAYQAVNLEPGTEYTFSVSAIDEAENESKQSPLLELTTEAEVYVDDLPPSTPASLMAGEVTENSINLQWGAATDNIGVTEYIIYQNGQRVKAATATSSVVNGLESNTEYSFSISATDAAQNESQQSETLTISTLEEEQTVDKILIFTKTAEFRHGSIEKGISTFNSLGAANNFEVDQTEDATDFTFNNLSRYKTVVFLNTTGDVLNATQQIAFERYIQSGGSYMGVHAATDTEYNWSWYGELVGAYFDGHPNIQEATLNVIDSNHSSTSHLPLNWVRTEEWYNFKAIYRGINPLILLDESTYNGGTNGASHPFSWYHTYDGGRAFYTGGGHSNASYDEPDFRDHLLGGLMYCLGR